MPSNMVSLSRRTFLGAGVAAAAALTSLPAQALTTDQAKDLVNTAVGEINAIIASGKPDAQIFAAFEQLFARYADVSTIARSALGPAARQASPAEMKAFTAAYQGYIARKYGKRFREFSGGRIEVLSAKPLKSYFEVSSVAHLRNQSPFAVNWHVSDKGGRNLFFNIIIEGVNMLASERSEIGSMLNKRKGDINALIADLKKA